LSLLLSKFVGGLFAIISGMSLGREGPSIQIGAAVAKGYSKKRQTSPEDTRLLITAGAAAGLAAAFNAPIAASLFVLEEIHKSISSFILIPALIS
ncbi:chloride channel protein, partial [Streptococcus pasteurianus]